MKKYRLYWNLGVTMMYAVPPLMAIIGLVLVYVSISHPRGGGPPLPFAIFWIGAVGWTCFFVLRIPHAIQVFENGRIEFISRLRRWTVSPREITYVGPVRGQLGFLVVKSSAGRIRLLNQFDGFHRFLTELEAANPAIEFRGC